MPEWLIERGIGETRCALVEDGEIVEARISLEGAIPAKSIISVHLASTGTNGRNAVATDERGTEYLLPRGSPGTTEGAMLNIEVAREAIPGNEPWKRPLAKVSHEPVREGGPIEGRRLAFPAPQDALGAAGWADLIEQARSGIVSLAGGELRISPTSAMTLIDVDGYLEPQELAVRGAAAAAQTIRRLDIGGSIGIDLPTTSGRSARQAAAEAIDEHLPQPFERTAVNGFGFVQIVRPRQRASLVELALDRASFEARALLRRAALDRPGAKRLVAHPAVIAILEGRPDWLDALARQVGGDVGLRADASLPMSGAYAEQA
ncbi:MAG TPA: ribonuclease [Sphingomicrobium sp.]|nr:ribonuclease [Sphingomicrobium sp.]